MPADTFIDTNVFLYAASTDPGEEAKREQARSVLSRPGWGLSVQVLQELYVNLTRPGSAAMTHEDAAALVRQLLRRPVVASDQALVLAALRLRQRYRISYWDAAIVAAARALRATTLLSEDLSHGQMYGGVRVENPFHVLDRGREGA